MPYYPQNVYIYSNDGSTQLAYFDASYVSVAVTETGTDRSYTYSGDKTFIGFATTPNATTPDYAVGDSFTVSGTELTLYIVEGGEEGPTATATITLNGNVIATLTEGQTATLVCGGKKMVGDIVITYGGEADNLISFTIDGTTYQAEDGMTWAEWLVSKYNTVGAVSMGLNLGYGGKHISYMNGEYQSSVLDEYEIIEGYAYFLRSVTSND